MVGFGAPPGRVRLVERNEEQDKSRLPRSHREAVCRAGLNVGAVTRGSDESAIGVKQTSLPHRKMSANDPKRTSAVVGHFSLLWL